MSGEEVEAKEGAVESGGDLSTQAGAGYRLGVEAFLRGLGLVYVAAFASLWWQIDGLLGSRGILPATRFLDAVWRSEGGRGVLEAPTLLWLWSGDGALHLLCALGALAGVLVLCARLRVLALACAWACYLSLTTAGQIFLGYQWDALLLEVGFLALLFESPRPAWRRPLATPPALALWLERWLLVRFMLASGIVKLTSGDPTWRSLTALEVHYETQPLPTWIGWYAHQLPAVLQRTSCLVMFTIELLVSLLVFAGRRGRRLAFVPLVGLQLLIALTGNYGFFNLLTVVLCLPLLDDELLGRLRDLARSWWRRADPPREAAADSSTTPSRPPAPPWPRVVRWGYAAVVLPLSLALLGNAIGAGLPGPALVVLRLTSPWQIVNPYGLFAVMTTERLEIEVQGSDDGASWLVYPFCFKPGPLDRRPSFVAPHQPRLDWQMWFAALGRTRGNPWFLYFLARLAEGDPAVLRLLESNPFPDGPPRFLRARLFRYRFTELATRRRTGDWWRREERGEYLPAVRAEALRRLLAASRKGGGDS